MCDLLRWWVIIWYPLLKFYSTLFKIIFKFSKERYVEVSVINFKKKITITISNLRNIFYCGGDIYVIVMKLLIYTYIYIIYIYICNICRYMCMYILSHTHKHTHTQTHTHTNIHTHIYIYLYLGNIDGVSWKMST